jgi:hypothetical protein
MSSELKTSEEICEALIRYIETTGADVFNKNFVRGKDGKILCTVWAVVGPEAAEFYRLVQEWVKTKEFTQDP